MGVREKWDKDEAVVAVPTPPAPKLNGFQIQIVDGKEAGLVTTAKTDKALKASIQIDFDLKLARFALDQEEKLAKSWDKNLTAIDTAAVLKNGQLKGTKFAVLEAPDVPGKAYLVAVLSLASRMAMDALKAEMFQDDVKFTKRIDDFYGSVVAIQGDPLDMTQREVALHEAGSEDALKIVVGLVMASAHFGGLTRGDELLLKDALKGFDGEEVPTLARLHAERFGAEETERQAVARVKQAQRDRRSREASQAARARRGEFREAQVGGDAAGSDNEVSN